ncbi:MAG: hypothetical protein LE180_06415, partial [Endomicrobium sp.]|uniref:hypothetical protein n=1 Tax=Candidatus Endomicrobiellum pyrsonymphae TaxID=1408203 RepID=UPI0035729DEE|nr:hypothetical protein [Endomicrobium sp.]
IIKTIKTVLENGKAKWEHESITSALFTSFSTSDFDIFRKYIKPIHVTITINIDNTVITALSKKNFNQIIGFVEKLKSDNLFSNKVNFALDPLHISYLNPQLCHGILKDIFDSR